MPAVKHIRTLAIATVLSLLLMMQSVLHNQLFFANKDVNTEEKNCSPDSESRSDADYGSNRVISYQYPEDEVSTKAQEVKAIYWNEIPQELFLKNKYSGHFSLPNPSICGRKKNVTLLILITTAVHHFTLRNAVRATWGHFGLRSDTAYAFVIGDALFPKHNASVLQSLQKEIDLYDDFIVAKFEDTYRNLTLKTIHMLDWVNQYCPQATYFLKTDDDVFINVPQLLQFISEVKEQDDILPKIYGHVFDGHLPERNSSHRHYVPFDLYPHDVMFPNFTSGPAYLMSTKIVQPLFDLALEFPFIPLEDVLLTGFVALSLNIPRVDLPGFLNEMHNPFYLKSCDLVRIYAGMTSGSHFEMYFIWHNYLKGKVTHPCNTTSTIPWWPSINTVTVSAN